MKNTNEMRVTLENLKAQIKSLEARKENIPDEILNYFRENDDEFTEVYKELDFYADCINPDDRIYPMEEINEHFSNPLDAMERAFYGYDAESYHTDADGCRHYGEFCPNREYFYYNGYGNLVSCDCEDYSDYCDSYAVENIMEYSGKLDLPCTVCELIEEYENIDYEIEDMENEIEDIESKIDEMEDESETN